MSSEAAGGNRHRRAGVRGAAGGRDAGLDIERVEAAGLFQRVQAGITHAFEKGAGWHRAAGRAGRSECRPAADRAASCRAGLRPAQAARRAPAIRGWRRWPSELPRRLRSTAGGSRLGRLGRRRCAGLAVEPRRQLPGELVEGAVLDRRQGRRSRLADGPERQDILGRFHGCFQIGWGEISCGIRRRRSLRRIGTLAADPRQSEHWQSHARRTSADSGCGAGGFAETFGAAQRGQPREAVEIAADAEAAIAGKFLRGRRPAGPTIRPATGRRRRPASSA